jgi:hypothetical protein
VLSIVTKKESGKQDKFSKWTIEQKLIKNIIIGFNKLKKTKYKFKSISKHKIVLIEKTNNKKFE